MNSLGNWVGEVVVHNRKQISVAAMCIARTHRAGGLVFTAGSGHSLVMVMEIFFRAGGLAIVRPLFHADMLPLNGAPRSTMTERETGVRTEVVTAIDPSPRDLVAIFSNSGRNPYPVEMAEGVRTRRAVVVALTSVGASQANPPRGAHHLYEVADVVLDTMVPPEDVSSPTGDPVASPLSTLACCAFWIEILADTVELDPGVCLWRSAGQDGNGGFDTALAGQLRDRIPEL